MAKEQSVVVAKSAKEAYEGLLVVAPEQGFTISRRRDIAYLLQASKEIDGKQRLFNVSCRPGKDTTVTMACLADEKDDLTAVNAEAQRMLETLASKLSD